MMFLIWIPKHQDLLPLFWSWWRSVKMSPFTLSGKISFSVVFKFFVFETSNSMHCWWLWIPGCGFHWWRFKGQSVISFLSLPIKGKGAICTWALFLVPCWFLCKAGRWAIPHLAAKLLVVTITSILGHAQWSSAWIQKARRWRGIFLPVPLTVIRSWTEFICCRQNFLLVAVGITGKRWRLSRVPSNTGPPRQEMTDRTHFYALEQG